MEALAYIHSAIAYEDPDPTPHLRSFQGFAQGISTPLLIHLVGVAIASSILVCGGAAMAQVFGPGDEGPTVSDIQQALGISADGIYGPQTEAAVRNFQSRRGLSVDGLAGPETLRALGLRYLLNDEVATGGPGGGTISVAAQNDRSSSQVRSGAIATVRTPSGVGVLVRDRPNGRQIGGLDENERVSLSGEIEPAGGYNWAKLRRGGWVATNFLVLESTGRPPTPGNAGSPYVVAIPGDSTALLARVRRYVPGAYRDTNRRGSFINAGAFSSRSNAERLSEELRDSGLDARVAYRP